MKMKLTNTKYELFDIVVCVKKVKRPIKFIHFFELELKTYINHNLTYLVIQG